MSQWKVSEKSQEITDLNDLLVLLLKNRGFSTTEDQELFLNPPPMSFYVNNLSNDFKTNLKKARNKIQEYINAGHPIVIHGDYDVDGICATAILFNTIKFQLNYKNVYASIPNRFEHGYGLSYKSIDSITDKIKENGQMLDSLLFVTVDSGITSVEAVKYIKEQGYEVIITDHHQKPAQLPDADVILWNDEVVGTTISWLLSCALGSKKLQDVSLAALATVTDVQPLLGFNRTIVKKGLEILNTNPPLGLKKIVESGKKNIGEITTYDLGWFIGPRLNASGRLVDASDSLLLLVENDEKILDDVVFKLNQVNEDRQDKTLEMYELAVQEDTQDLPKIIISHNQNYHEGIIGLVASKLVQKYHRPAIVMSVSEDFAKGSVRSIEGVDIISILRKHDDFFVNLGGHPMAAGFTIDKKNIQPLTACLIEYCEQNIDSELLNHIIKIDLEIPLNFVNLDLFFVLDKLKPYGVGNNEPVFLSKNVDVVNISWVGSNNQHLSLRITEGCNFFKAMLFNAAENELAKNIKIGDKLDIVYKLKKNEYNGRISVDLMLVDLNTSAGYIN